MKILEFMQTVYAANEADKRKLRYLYRHSGIGTRYSAIPDFSLPASQWQFFHATENLEPFPSLDSRMQCFNENAGKLAMDAVKNCIPEEETKNITHLITVSCTGMSAPGLDLELLELLDLSPHTWRTSVNFMGCYAAIHALKLADLICRADHSANVLLVCVELCTLHFQKEYTENNITSSLLFGDGAAAMLVSGDNNKDGLKIENFYSTISLKGKQDMAWEMSAAGFQMTLSGYVPSLIEEDFNSLVQGALDNAGLDKEDINYWCIHPGGKKILEAVHHSLAFTNGQLQHCYDVLNDYGNLSSPTVIFVLDRIRRSLKKEKPEKIFGAAFGPGLTMETFILSA
jgi:predicted naringenin-chalcone synthase